MITLTQWMYNPYVRRKYRHLLSLAGHLVHCGLLFCVTNVWSAETEGRELFEKRCAVCHTLPNPGQPPPDGWEQQLQFMAPLARLEVDQKQEVLQYLQSHSRDASMEASLDEDRLLFEEKCSRCHTLDRILLRQLGGEDLTHVINRMQSRSGTDWLSNREVVRILDYLSETPRDAVPAVALDSSATPEQIFTARCSACHSLERIFSRLSEDEDADEFWSHTISRMRGKAPQWMPESEADKILEYLRSFSQSVP